MESKVITVEEVKRKLEHGEKILFLDTRSPNAWDGSNLKIKGAVRMHYSEMENRLAEIPENEMIVAYCTWNNEASSARAALMLMNNGYSNVFALKDGFDAWLDAGLPVEQK